VHLDSMSVVNHAVECAVSNRIIAYLFMSACHERLRGQYHTSGLVALFANLREIAAFWFGGRSHCPVVDHQHVYAADPGKEMAETSISATQGELPKQRGPRGRRGLVAQ
jgi:hypothetical protein